MGARRRYQGAPLIPRPHSPATLGRQGSALLDFPGFPSRRVFAVANIKSQIKRIGTNNARAERNKGVRSELKTRVKNAVATKGQDSNDEAVVLAVKKLDKAASKGVIHKNEAARRKSRLMKKLKAG